MHAIDDDPPRLTDLRGAQPADVTFQNLLQLLKEKIEICGRLAVYEYEARSEEHFECAEGFRALAAAERASYESLLRSLTGLLGTLNGTTPEGVRPGVVARLSPSSSSTTAGE